MAEVEEVTEPLQKVKVQKDETVSIAQNYIFHATLVKSTVSYYTI